MLFFFVKYVRNCTLETIAQGRQQRQEVSHQRIQARRGSLLYFASTSECTLQSNKRKESIKDKLRRTSIAQVHRSTSWKRFWQQVDTDPPQKIQADKMMEQNISDRVGWKWYLEDPARVSCHSKKP